MFRRLIEFIVTNTTPVYIKLSKLVLHYLFQWSTLPRTILNIHGACMLHHLNFLQNEHIFNENCSETKQHWAVGP